jgi:hypothetical protein
MSTYDNRNPSQPQPTPPGAAGVDPQRPIDTALANLIQATRVQNRGFALTLAGELDASGHKKHTFTVDPVLPPADEWEAPAPYRNHTVNDVDSLIAMARKYSNAERGLVLVNDDGVTLVLDEIKDRGRRETVTLEWELSKAWEEWAKIVNGEAVQHKPLFKFLTRRQSELIDPEILQAMRSVKATATIKADSQIRDAGESVGVVFETQAGDDLIKFPKAFDVAVPVFEGGEYSRNIEIKVEIVMPSEPRQPVTFLLLSDDWDAVKRDRIAQELSRLRTELEGWTVVRGCHGETARQLGRGK